MIEPTSESALSDAVAGASGPLAIRGGGTRDIGRAVTGQVLSTAGLTGVRLYEPAALTLVAGAGTPVAEVSALLAKENQRLAFDPPDLRALLGTQGASTLGGIVAANASGPRRVHAGACRDHLLGVRFVDGRGRVIQNGGRVMKNVTGYDLAKLMAGSWGTLGVLSEVSLKVLPIPETSGTLVVEAADAARALDLLTAAMVTPFEVTGAGWWDGAVRLRVEGFEDQVRYRLTRLAELLGGAPAQTDWDGFRDLAMFAGADTLWRVSLPPSAMAQLIASGAAGAGRIALDWGGALAWIEGAADTGDLHAAAGRLGGHALLVKAPAERRASGPVFQPEAAVIARISAGLRAQFDPREILNPGRMG